MINTKVINYFDTHCHLDLYKDYKDIICEAKENNTLIVAVTNMPSVFEHEVALFNYDNVLVSLGLHPQLINEYGHEIKLLIDLLPKSKIIGEIGLDYQNVSIDLKKKQKVVFEKIVTEAAKYKNKILSVHSRRSSEDVVAIIGSDFVGTVILHWFSGSGSTLNKALSSGYYFSINPAMTVSNNGQTIIKALPLERILTETDGPFTNLNNAVIKPSDVQVVISYLANLHGKSKDEVVEIIKNNTLKIFNG